MPEKQYFTGIDVRSGNTVITSVDVKDSEARQSLDDLEDYVESIAPVALSVTQNGTYTAPTGVFGYSPVTVNVQPNVGTKNISDNGTYTASADQLDGYSSVTVAVSKDFYPKAHATLDDASRVEGDDMRIYPMGGTDYYPYVYLGAMPYPAQQGDDFEPCGKYFAGQTQEHTVTTFLDLIDVATGESVSGYPQRVASNWSISIVDGGYMKIVSWTVKASGAVSVTTERYNPTYTKPLQDTKDSAAVTGGKLDAYLDTSYYIDGGAGESVLLQSLTATANGTYTAPARTAYNEVNVNVPAPAIVTKHIRGNGIFSAADDNVAGYSDVIVDASPNNAFSMAITLNDPEKLTIKRINTITGGYHDVLLMYGDGTEITQWGGEVGGTTRHTYPSTGTYVITIYPLDDKTKSEEYYTWEVGSGTTFSEVTYDFYKLPYYKADYISDGAGWHYSYAHVKRWILPPDVTALDTAEFGYNAFLEEVYMQGTTPPVLSWFDWGIPPFGECPNLTAIYVPASAVNAYKTASGWSAYADIIQPMPL